MNKMPKVIALLVATVAVVGLGHGAASAAPATTTGSAVAFDTGWD